MIDKITIMNKNIPFKPTFVYPPCFNAMCHTANKVPNQYMASMKYECQCAILRKRFTIMYTQYDMTLLNEREVQERLRETVYNNFCRNECQFLEGGNGTFR